MLLRNISSSKLVKDITILLPPSLLVEQLSSEDQALDNLKLLPGNPQCIKLTEVLSICSSEMMTLTMKIYIIERLMLATYSIIITRKVSL